MPANRFNGFTDLGIGIGLRAKHYADILSTKPSIDWFEIISENFMVGGGRPLAILDQILESHPVVQHGVSLYFGSCEPFDEEQLQKLKALVQRTKTPFLTDHLCWGSANGRISHDLLPLAYTKEAVKHVAERIKFINHFLEVPICVENISSYAELVGSEMTEWQFLSEVAEAADCGILLDVNNVYVAATNHGFDPRKYIDALPLERVGQIHLAGNSIKEGYLLDTHDSEVCPDVWSLYEYVIGRTGPTNTLLEWDANIPPVETVYAHALRAKQFWGSAVRQSA